MQGGDSTPRQTFAEHIHELRRRLTYIFLVLLAGSAIGYMLHKQLLHILSAPLKQQLYYTSPLGGFNAIMKISIMFGVILAVPVAIYHFIKFLAPTFRSPGHLRSFRFVFTSLVLAAAGVSVAYFFSLPAALHFLSQITGSELQPFIVVNDYLNFVLAYLVGFAILFQIPLVMLFINKVKPQQPRKLMANQRWVILASFVLAAILTPTPDPLNQTLMAAPMIALYQVGVSAVWVQNRNRRGHLVPVPRAAAEKIEPQQPVTSDPIILQPEPIPAAPRYLDIIPPPKTSATATSLYTNTRSVTGRNYST